MPDPTFLNDKIKIKKKAEIRNNKSNIFDIQKLYWYIKVIHYLKLAFWFKQQIIKISFIFIKF